MATLYALTLVGASAAAMGAAFMGGNLHPIGETGTQEEVQYDLPPKEDPVEEKKEEVQYDEPVPEPVQQTVGGGFGRPSWAPMVATEPIKTVGTIVSNVVQSVPSSTVLIQQELNKVTTDWESVSYDLYDLDVKKKDILDKLSGPAGIRTKYRDALVKVTVGKRAIETVNKKIENPGTGEKGMDILKRIIGDDINKKGSENEKGKHQDYLKRLDELVEKRTEPEIIPLKRNGVEFQK